MMGDFLFRSLLFRGQQSLHQRELTWDIVHRKSLKWERKLIKNYRKSEDLARVLKISSGGPMGLLKSNGVKIYF